MRVPTYIGYPGKQTSGGYGNDFDSKYYDNIVDERIVVASLTPGIPVFTSKDANVFDLVPAWDEYYVKDLEALNIDEPIPPDGLPKNRIYVVISNLSPISRSYNNNYGDSKVLPTGGILGEAAQDIAQLSGSNTEQMEKFLNSKDGDMIRKTLGTGVSWYNKSVEAFRNLGGEVANRIGGSIGNILGTSSDIAADLAKSPQSKIGWPKMWRDCSFEQSYQLNTRLYCYSTDNEDDFNNNIRAAIAALELFVTPKSDKGVLYTAPYILEFEIPGMLYFPQAYVSNMTVTEGGQEGDFAHTGRPNVVDITMNIQNMYSISTNTPPEEDKKHPGRPSVYKDMIGLASGKNLGKSSYYNPTSSNTAPKTVLFSEALTDSLYKDKAMENAKAKLRNELKEAQKKADEALKKAGKANDIDEDEEEEPTPEPETQSGSES